MAAFLKFSEGVRRMLEAVALASGWLLVAMAAVTCFDVVARRTGIPAPLTRIELAGCLLFALPYCALVAYHSLDFVASSYGLAEQSDSTVGLRFRWLIKGIYAAGLWLVVLGILSVLARVIVFLFGGRPEEEVNLQIGHTEAEV